MAPKTEVNPENRPYKKKRIYSSLGEIVKFLAGKDKTPVIVHKKLICEASTLVRKACEDKRNHLSDEFTKFSDDDALLVETIDCKDQHNHLSDKIIKLPDDDVLLVQTMVYWIYHDIIRIPEFSSSGDRAIHSYSPDGGYYLLIRLFVLANKLEIPRLKNDAIDAIIQIWNDDTDGLTPESVNYVYSNTRPDSILRSLMVTLVRYDFGPEAFEAVGYKFCSDFKVKLIARFMESEDKLEQQLSPDEDFCAEYHFHGEGGHSECRELKEFETTTEI